MASKHATYFLPKMQWEWLLKERPHTRSGVQKRSTKVVVTGDWMGTRLSFHPPQGLPRHRNGLTSKWLHDDSSMCWFDSPVLLGYLPSRCLPMVGAYSDVQTLKQWHCSVAGGELYITGTYILFFLHYGISYFFSKPKLCPIVFATEFLVLDKFTQQLHGC